MQIHFHISFVKLQSSIVQHMCLEALSSIEKLESSSVPKSYEMWEYPRCNFQIFPNTAKYKHGYVSWQWTMDMFCLVEKARRVISFEMVNGWNIAHYVLQGRVETKRQKQPSWAFLALKFSIRAISSTIFDFELSMWAISSRKIVEHFKHGKILCDHLLEKIFEKSQAFFEGNQSFSQHNRAESTVNTNFWQICTSCELKTFGQIIWSE